MKYITQHRIRWWVSAFFQIILFASVFLPMVKIVAIDQNVVNVDTVSRSALWYLSSAGYPEIYGIILTLFAVLSLPILCLGFRFFLKPAALMVAAVTDIIYLLVNVFWTVFILLLSTYGDFSTSTTLTPWFFVGTAINLAQIVHLFILFFGVKKALTRKPQ
ncbi:MAG: hypothetical protein IIW94_02195 [Clostridia bacterium]|nr:hypothetical protein [Clostridia bacterium]